VQSRSCAAQPFWAARAIACFASSSAKLVRCVLFGARRSKKGWFVQRDSSSGICRPWTAWRPPTSWRSRPRPICWNNASSRALPAPPPRAPPGRGVFARRNQHGVGQPAEVEHETRFVRFAEQEEIGEGDDGSTLATGGEVAGAEVVDDGDPGALGQNGRGADG